MHHEFLISFLIKMADDSEAEGTSRSLYFRICGKEDVSAINGVAVFGHTMSYKNVL